MRSIRLQNAAGAHFGRGLRITKCVVQSMGKLRLRYLRSHLLTVILLCLLMVAPLYAAADVDTLVRGNQLYEKGDFAAATQLYEELVSQGGEDSTLYYNLGNAYYKQRQLGRAILNYTRAAQLDPRDDDIRTNLALARSQVADKYEATGESPLGGLLTTIRSWLTVDELATLTLLLWAAIALLWIVYRRLRQSSVRMLLQGALIIGFVLLVGGATALGSILNNERQRPPAIVLNPEIKVTSGPGEQYAVEFTLHSGAEVSLLEERGNWVRIALPGGQMQGWTPKETVAKIAQ